MGENAGELRRNYPHTVPSVIRQGPLFGFGYRSPWLIWATSFRRR